MLIFERKFVKHSFLIQHWVTYIACPFSFLNESVTPEVQSKSLYNILVSCQRNTGIAQAVVQQRNSKT